MRVWTALCALLGHWRRHPVEFVTLLAGLAVATALWSGVQALNAEARASYARAASTLGADALATIRARDGQRFALADYVALRRAGWRVTPVLEGDWRASEASLRVMGIDPLTLPPTSGRYGLDIGADRVAQFLQPPNLALAAPATVERLAGLPGLPPLEATDALPPDTILVDMAVAERLLGVRGWLSRLLIAPSSADRALPPALAARLEIVGPQETSDLDRLTDSFHLNLTAFGFLSFVVGLFIVYAAIGLAFERRKPMLRTLRACGVSARLLAAVMVAELVAIALVAGLIGVVVGYGIAVVLLPDVAASLRGLYGARVPGALTLSPTWWISGIAISVLGALGAASTSLLRAWRLPLLAPAQPQAWRTAQARSLRIQFALAAACGLGAVAALLFGDGLVAGFAVMGGLLVAAALTLPALLAAILSLGARTARGPVSEWAWADSRQQLSGLSLALMALLLALGVNVGVGTMVGSFRATFVGWLDQRLAAEIYVNGRDEAEAARIADWLAARPEVGAVLPIWNASTRFRDWPTEVYGFRDDPTYRDNWPLLASLPDAWDQVAAGDGVLVSEQLARRFDLETGDKLEIHTPGGPWALTLAAIYSDYGNPEGQVMLDVDELTARWPEIQRQRFAVRTDPGAVAALSADLRADLDLAEDQVVDQQALKAFSRGIFDRTFAVTLALNALTFAVAGIALLTSLLTLSNLRLVQVAPLWAMGITRRRLALIELGKALILAALTALAALPLGLAVAWVLTAIINVQAFGWRLPILLFPLDWAALLALALATAGLAALWPAWRLRTTAPLRLIEGFSNER